MAVNSYFELPIYRLSEIGNGRECIPNECLDGICEWPRSVGWMQRLGEATAEL
ncbi:MAG: hypothetical protein KDB22_02240 [Planctomycetales bacterium]|nr:hypothetical protein [Planctomycetales bacterium]